MDTGRNDRDEILQSLWGGYGRILRRRDSEGSRIVKDIRWPAGPGDASHLRKLRSYQVEAHWYRSWAARVPESCRIAACLNIDSRPDGTVLELEDLDAAGFHRRSSRLGREDLLASVSWLARFHAAFLGASPDGLWKEGSYWHLATRRQELESMPEGPLREAASDLDRRLSRARFRTIVHGDAKPDNFCLGRPGQLAMVDFQYAGGGCGMRDLAYLLDCHLDDAIDDASTAPLLDAYFKAFRPALPAAHLPLAERIEDEWRTLFPVAWLDFQRFLQGWSPAYARPSARLCRRIQEELERPKGVD